MRRLPACLVVLSLMSAAVVPAQEPTPPVATASSAALTVFLDCQDVFCDFDFFRTDITAVNWVRDRAVADIHILVTGQDTGAGGRDFTATFIGLRRFAGLVDTLHYVAPPSFTDDERRKGLAKMFRAGMVRFVARTPAGDKMTVSFGDAGQASAQTTTKTDPWKAWVFNVDGNIWTYGEQTYSEYSVHGRLSANRITENWKTQISANQNYSDSKNTYSVLDSILPDSTEVFKDTTVNNPRRNYRGSLLHVKSLGPHWSAGLRAEVNSSTYENTKWQVRMTPAIEFDVYPYKESTRRQIRIEYGAGFTDNAYRDTTIDDRIKETLPFHRLSTSVSQRQPWGSVDIGLTGTQYLHEAGKYHISSYGGVDIRLFKGFSVSFYGNYDVIHDQFSLAKKEFSPEQILLRQFQRGSTYSYYFSGGIRYTFGSIYNNVVNPRFD